MNRLLTPFRVGLVVIAGIGAFFVLLSFVGRQKYGDKATYQVNAVFKDASGLGPKSRVQIAGIEVGVVDRIELTPAAEALAVLRIRNDVVLHADARLTKRSASLLGDFLLDLFPGTPGKPPLEDGGTIARVANQPGVEDVFASLGDVTRDIQAVTTSLKGLLASDEVGSIKEIIRSINEIALGLNRTIERAGGRLDHILGDVEVLSGDLRGLARGEQKNIEAIVRNIQTFTEQANRVMATLDKVVGSGEGELKDSVASVKATLDSLQKTLARADDALKTAQLAVEDGRGAIGRVDGTVRRVDNLLAGVEKGEGTFGKLMKDDGVATKLDKTVADINALIAPLSEMRTHVHLREELHYAPGAATTSPVQAKSVVQLRLSTKPDKYYGLELVSEPRGRIKRQKVVTIRTPPAANEVPQQVEQTTVTTDDLMFSAYLAKRFGPANLRVGLIESTGGGGVDLFALQDKLRLSVDAFDWSNPEARFPRLRVSANGHFADHLFLGIGVDDALNAHVLADGKLLVGRDVYATGGIQFTDEDLKALLTVIGLPKPP
jgi:phospholipid/cholesterol/gamma-HCH transport system substrate-binding protein